ncbi:MAG TPA: ATPase, T2SS/T4P/T4SS family, partial [Burkholderiales bacterium]|nr:ATPase, T2SS/T4P/T4SS family [Burkholderiales bacterium]
MQQVVKTPQGAQKYEGRLALGHVLDWLVADGMAGAEAAGLLKKERRYYRGTTHPLVIVADQKWKIGNTLLTLDVLSEWLAKRVGMEYMHIDPLKIDFAAVTDMMSSAYATRFRILPVAVTPKEAVIATAEPGVRDWEPELARIIKRDIIRVISNPLDIERFQVEFYNLAKSMKGAKVSHGGAGGLSNFEQLVELGKTNKQLDANDQGVVQVVDWLWQYAFDQRASDIHLEPRREQGVIRFRIDGVLHPVYQVPLTVMNAMIARIKLLGRMDVVEKRRPLDGRNKTTRPDTADGPGG